MYAPILRSGLGQAALEFFTELSGATVFVRPMDGDAAIAPYYESDLVVDIVCDRAKIRTSNIFFRTEIENLLDEGLEVNM